MRWPPPADWPMAPASRLIPCRPHRWHVQDQGHGPTVLLLHGAGGAAQSWRNLVPLLVPTCHVIAVDFPGQGFSRAGTPNRAGLQAIAADLAALLRQQAWTPDLIVGHSAGAAVALQLVLDGLRPARGIVGINAALATFRGAAGVLFPLMARALAAAPLTARIFAATTTETRVARLLQGTGSQIEPAGVRHYLRLASDTDHVDGTLAMMAQWDLTALADRLPDIAGPVLLLTGEADRAVPPATSIAAAARIPQGQHISLGAVGHLAHEEDPQPIAAIIADLLR